MNYHEEKSSEYCSNCAQKRCYWHIKVPIVKSNDQESNEPKRASEFDNKMKVNENPRNTRRRMKEEEICRRELGKLIETQVGRETFSCLSVNCHCKCKKPAKFKRVKKFSKGAAVVGLMAAGTGIMAVGFLIPVLTMGAGFVAAPPLLFGGLGLITGASFEVANVIERRHRKKTLMASYKGKILDPRDFGIDIDVDGATPLCVFFSEDMSEIFLSSSETTKIAEKFNEPEKVSNSDQQARIHSPYVIQLPHPHLPNEDLPQLHSVAIRQDPMYQPRAFTSQPGFSDTMPSERSVINQTLYHEQMPLSRNNLMHFDSGFAQENFRENAYPLRWSEQFQLEQPNHSCSIPCYVHASNDKLQYINHTPSNQQPSDV